MKLLPRIVAHSLLVVGLIIFMIMPANRYSWMQELVPSISDLPNDDAYGSRVIFTLLLLITIAAVQLAIAIKSTSRIERAVSITLMLVAISVWSLKFLG